MCNNHKAQPRINVHRREQRLCWRADQYTQVSECPAKRGRAASTASSNGKPHVKPERNHGYPESVNRIYRHTTCAQPHDAGLYRHHDHAGVNLFLFLSNI